MKKTERQIISFLRKKGFVKGNKMTFELNTKTEEIKPKDFVVTFEIHQVKEPFENRDWTRGKLTIKKEFSCNQVLPVSKYQDKNGVGRHEYIKRTGAGQQGITKLIRFQRKK